MFTDVAYKVGVPCGLPDGVQNTKNLTVKATEFIVYKNIMGVQHLNDVNGFASLPRQVEVVLDDATHVMANVCWQYGAYPPNTSLAFIGGTLCGLPDRVANPYDLYTSADVYLMPVETPPEEDPFFVYYQMIDDLNELVDLGVEATESILMMNDFATLLNPEASTYDKFLASLGFVPINKIIDAGKLLIVFKNPAGKYTLRGVALTDEATEASKDLNYLYSCNCFVAGTKVLTDEGEKNIEDIEVGDKVLSKYEETGEQAYKEVVALHRNQKDTTYKLSLGNHIIETTDNHPFWVDGKGWVLAIDLKVGDELVQSDGNHPRIDNIEIVHHDEKVKVYNFTVADFHTYFVSDLGIWVHNIGDCSWDSIVKILGKIKNIIGDIPDSYKKWGKCKEFAGALEEGLKADGINGRKIFIQSSTGQIYSEKLGKSVTDNGEHVAIRVGDIVYDNLNPNGIPYKEWADDLALDDPFFKQYFDLSKSYDF